jgi:hypothetical protein
MWGQIITVLGAWLLASAGVAIILVSVGKSILVGRREQQAPQPARFRARH